MGAKKGRKKALDRVAILDKEIIEVQRKEHGIETLIQVDSGKVHFTDTGRKIASSRVGRSETNYASKKRSHYDEKTSVTGFCSYY